MMHEIKQTLTKLFTGKYRNWVIVAVTLLILLAATAIMGSVQVRVSSQQPATYAQSSDKSADVPEGSEITDPDKGGQDVVPVVDPSNPDGKPTDPATEPVVPCTDPVVP